MHPSASCISRKVDLIFDGHISRRLLLFITFEEPVFGADGGAAFSSIPDATPLLDCKSSSAHIMDWSSFPGLAPVSGLSNPNLVSIAASTEPFISRIRSVLKSLSAMSGSFSSPIETANSFSVLPVTSGNTTPRAPVSNPAFPPALFTSPGTSPVCEALFGLLKYSREVLELQKTIFCALDVRYIQ